MMMQRDEERILKSLHDQNPWWTSNEVPEVLARPFRRRDFHSIRDELQKNEIQAIVGPRQTGKTTVMYQLVEHLVETVNPRRLVYFSFDYPYVAAFTEKPLTDILEVYSSDVLREPIGELGERVYVFLDEVCKLDNWSRVLKGWYDLKRPIKFIVSDSSSLGVLTGSSESLVGRIDIRTMLSFDFVDAVGYHGTDLGEPGSELGRAMRSAVEGDAPGLLSTAKRVASDLVPIEDRLKIHLQDYLLKDGYPGVLGVDSLEECSRKLRTYADLTIYKDLVRLFDIRDPRALEDLIALIAQESSQRMSYLKLSRTLGLKLDTVKRYLDYLESAFLISRSEFYAGSRASRIRKSRKIYLSNAGLRNAIIGSLSEDTLRSADVGRIAETVVFDHCRRLAYRINAGPSPLFYWRSQQGKEVDIVMELLRRPVPVEVKFRDRVPQSELSGIERFLDEHSCPFGLVITKDSLTARGDIVLLPLWLFLIMC